MKILALTVPLLLAASPAAAQTSHVQQPLGVGGQTNNSPLTDTGVICLQEMVATSAMWPVARTTRATDQAGRPHRALRPE